MGVTVSHALSVTTPDDPSYELQAKHWNSTHAITFAQNWQATGNTTQSTSGSGDGMFISGAGIASVGVSNNSLIVSVPAGAPSPVNFSAGTTSNNLGSVVFSNSNGLAFGLNGSTITGSYTVPAAFSAGISGGNTSGDTGTVTNRIVFAGGNNITVSGSTNAGGMSVTISGANAGGAQTGISGIGASNTTYTSGTVIWSGQANVTVGSSVDGASQYVRLSAYAPVVSNAIQSVGSATNAGTNTSRFAADDHVHAGVFSMGVTNAGNTVGDTRVDVGRFVLQGGNNVTLSQITAANALNTIVISGANAGGAQTGISGIVVSDTTYTSGTVSFSNQNGVTIGSSANGATQYIRLSVANQTNQTGISGVGVSDTTYSSGTVIWSAQANVTLNSSVNGASQYVRISVADPGAGAGVTLTGYKPQHWPDWGIDVVSNATLRFAPIDLPAAVQFDRVINLCNYSQATNSTLTVTISYSQGLYTKNGSTMSLAHSMSASMSIDGAGTNSSSVYSGLRLISFPWTTTIPAGNYYAGIWYRTTTAGANASFSVGYQTARSNFSGMLGEGTAASKQFVLGMGYYGTSFSTAMPASVAFSDLIGTASQHQRMNWFHYTSGTA